MRLEDTKRYDRYEAMRADVKECEGAGSPHASSLPSLQLAPPAPQRFLDLSCSVKANGGSPTFLHVWYRLFASEEGSVKANGGSQTCKNVWVPPFAFTEQLKSKKI